MEISATFATSQYNDGDPGRGIDYDALRREVATDPRRSIREKFIGPRGTRYLHARLTRGTQFLNKNGDVMAGFVPCAVRDVCIQLAFMKKHEEFSPTQDEVSFGTKGDEKFRSQKPHGVCFRRVPALVGRTQSKLL
jgi:hypothetical protein